MILQDFYHTVESGQRDGKFFYDVTFNIHHPIYAAHFPSHPITPGACLLQISHELIEQTLGKKLFLAFIKNLKFLNIIEPVEGNIATFLLDIEVKEDIKAGVEIISSSGVCSKMSLVFKEVTE